MNLAIEKVNSFSDSVIRLAVPFHKFYKFIVSAIQFTEQVFCLSPCRALFSPLWQSSTVSTSKKNKYPIQSAISKIGSRAGMQYSLGPINRPSVDLILSKPIFIYILCFFILFVRMDSMLAHNRFHTVDPHRNDTFTSVADQS
jgi:hypothetical protein